MDIPQPPQMTPEAFACYQDLGDYASVLCEWYRYVGKLCAYCSGIRRESAALHAIASVHYAVLTGLLTRCARLMYSNIVLSREGLFGETTAILDRCIVESAIKVIWLCTKANDESFTRFLASGLQADLALKDKITTIIAQRGGPPQKIEQRMLDSIQRYINLSGLSEVDIDKAKRLPDLASMIAAIGHTRLLYTVAQEIGSHPIHGTWSNLLTHYLEEQDGELRTSYRKHETDRNQYSFVALLVLEALRVFVTCIFRENGAAALLKQLAAADEAIRRIHSEASGDDYEPVDI
jgi:uncharacterized protein DUF5677